VNGETEARKLAALRVAVYTIWLVNLLARPFHLHGEMAEVLLRPVGIFAWIPIAGWDMILTPAVLHGIRWTLAASLVAGILGVRPFPLIAAANALLILLFDGIGKCFLGFVNHAEIAAILAAVVLVLAPGAADRWSVMGNRTGERPVAEYATWTLVAGMGMLLAYSFISAHRLQNGLGVYTGGALLVSMVNLSMMPVETHFQGGLLVMEHSWMGRAVRAGFLVTTVLEFLSPLILWSRRFRWLWLLVMVPFHVSTLYFMNIFFWENLVLIGVLFTGWEYWRRGPGEPPAPLGGADGPDGSEPQAATK
jgi:hypothetical protein